MGALTSGARLICVVGQVIALSGSMRAAALPDCGTATACTSSAGAGTFGVGVEDVGQASPDVASGAAAPTAQVLTGLDAICVNTAISQQRDPVEFCGLESDAAPQLTEGMVAAAFARVPLPPSRLIVQPPHGRTLVNFETNFYTDNALFDVAPLRLLGHRVEIHVVPSVWTWRFGDGASVVTDRPGSAYPRLDITHRYLTKGRVVVSLDTTYRGRYRVDGGGWNDVQGEVTIPGDPAELEVVTATPTLVGY